jgi:release factor glutamine methyltransferase
LATVQDLLSVLPTADAETLRAARHLLAHLLGARSSLGLWPETAVPEEAARRFEELRPRLLRRTPVQYLIGEWDFFGRTFRVDERALIPRPESEHLVEEALRETAAPRRILDMGCGSGILAVTLALEFPGSRVVGVDLSLDALALSRENALRHSVGSRSAFLASDWAAALGGAKFNLAVANPPYVALADRGSLSPGVRDFEPPEALFAGQDGLTEIRRLLDELPGRLEAGAPFLFEFGFGQRDAVAEEVRRRGRWALSRIVEDLAGIPRVAVLRAVSAAA